MSVKIKPQMRKNPQDLEATPKYYAASVADGEIDFDYLATEIIDNCTVTEADCLAVLVSFEKQIIKHLQQGKIVRLGRLGSFQVGIRSEGKETADEVSALAVIQKRVVFRPGTRMRTMLNNLKFSKVG